MIKRPVHNRFNTAILEGRKITTIRDKPWPVGKPIMLYNWLGRPYHSNQSDLTPVIVSGFWTIQITHHADGTLSYLKGMQHARELYETEGFDSREDMDTWFRPLVKPGMAISKCLMRFNMLNGEVSNSGQKNK